MRRSARIAVLSAALVTTGIASPLDAGAATSGNAPNAKACQKGGFVNYATSTGERFANAGACTTYASEGGTLVPLPDLVITSTCTTSGMSATCSFTVRNVGIGPAAGTIEVRATSQVVTTGLVSSSASVDANGCNGTAATSVSADGATATGTCPGPLLPGATLQLVVEVDGGGTTSPSTVTIRGAVDPGGTITESNEANNTVTRTFTV